MKTNAKTKFVHEVSADQDKQITTAVRKPFRLEQENTRRFIRLDISSPMSLIKLKDEFGNFRPNGDWHVVNGSILNISVGGVLTELDQSVSTGDIVSMTFTLQEVESLQNVLGVVKRADLEDGVCLAGIQFISRSQLSDILSQAQMDILPKSLVNFNDGVKELLKKYIITEKSEILARKRKKSGR
ncbi:MAG: PilZ domain-containing protein [candidate division Zixibacteria bacterium]|nr:PilZ domain-containing protein [candidate division Zixibacteria bacterium]